MKIIAHRGYSQSYKENTFKAVIEAFKAGADACELDIHLTADRRIFFNHDYYLNGRRIRELKFHEAVLLKQDCMTWIELRKFTDEGKFFILEVKDRDMIDVLCTQLKRVNTDCFLISSFDAIFLKDIKDRLPEIKTVFNIGSVLERDEIIRLVKKLRCEYVIPAWESRHPYPYVLIDEDFIAGLLEKGIKTIIWHEERPEVLKKVLNLPAYGICTNDPVLVKRLIEKANEGSSSNS